MNKMTKSHLKKHAVEDGSDCDDDEKDCRVEFEDLEAEREAWRATLAVGEKQGNKVIGEVAKMELKRLRGIASKQNKKTKQKKRMAGAAAEKLMSDEEVRKAAEKWLSENELLSDGERADMKM